MLFISNITMFRVDIDETASVFDLYYEGVVTVRFSSEAVSAIPVHTTGIWRFLTRNGTFSLTWNEKEFLFECGKYGDGLGGMLLVTIPMTSELMSSFQEAVQKYNLAIQAYRDDM